MTKEELIEWIKGCIEYSVDEYNTQTNVNNKAEAFGFLADLEAENEELKEENKELKEENEELKAYRVFIDKDLQNMKRVELIELAIKQRRKIDELKSMIEADVTSQGILDD